jgi:hypothetical protein
LGCGTGCIDQPDTQDHNPTFYATTTTIYDEPDIPGRGICFTGCSFDLGYCGVGPKETARVIMIRRSTWIVLVIFLLLLGAMIISQRMEANPEEDQVDFTTLPTQKPVEYLLDLPESEIIVGILIRDADGNEVDIQRKNESASWEMISPTGEADSILIDQNISQVGSIQINSTLDPNLDLGSVGLDAPAFTIRLTLESGRRITIYIGDVTISGSGFYARKPGGAPLVVGKYAVDQIVNLLTMPPIIPTSIPSAEPVDGEAQP